MKKVKKIMVTIVSIILVLTVVCGAWLSIVRIRSKRYNLIDLRTTNIFATISSEIKEADITLSETKIHYAVYGHGKKSIILIHGNGASHKSLEQIALYLANDYTVYAPDSRCHGQSSDPGVISYKLIAKDIYEFINELKIDKPYVMGHSDGGIVALTLASEYPDLLSGVISCGANSNPSTFKPYFTWFVKISNKKSPNKLNDMMLELPDFTTEDFAKIKVPTYIVAGEHDIMWLSDSVYMCESISQSQIFIIKNANHSSYINDGKKGYALAKLCLDRM